MELVSIIIPIYNCEKFLNKCIDSLINQTYKNIEIILVNDGSTDSSLKIINKYAAKYKNIIVISQKNSGVSEARNKGIEIASGEFISFVDSDDWVEPNFIAAMVSKLKEENVDAIRCNCVKEYGYKAEKKNLYELANKKYEKKSNNYNIILNEHFLYNNEGIENYVMLLLIKSKIIKNKIKFEKKLYMMEDVYFYQQILNSINSIYFYDEYLYHYNNINTSTSATRNPLKAKKNIYGIIDTRIMIKKYLNDNNIKFDNAKINFCHMNLIITYLIRASSVLNFKCTKQFLKEMYNNKEFNKMLNSDLSQYSKFRKLFLLLYMKKKFLFSTILLKIKNLKK